MRKNVKEWGIKITQFKASLMAPPPKKKPPFGKDAHFVVADQVGVETVSMAWRTSTAGGGQTCKFLSTQYDVIQWSSYLNKRLHTKASSTEVVNSQKSEGYKIIKWNTQNFIKGSLVRWKTVHITGFNFFFFESQDRNVTMQRATRNLYFTVFITENIEKRHDLALTAEYSSKGYSVWSANFWMLM